MRLRPEGGYSYQNWGAVKFLSYQPSFYEYGVGCSIYKVFNTELQKVKILDQKLRCGEVSEELPLVSRINACSVHDSSVCDYTVIF